MKRLLTLLPLLALALAQTPAETLGKAVQDTFGDWSGKTYEGLDRVVYLTPEGKESEVFKVRSYVDPGGCRLRLDLAPEDQPGAQITVVYTLKRQFLRLPDGREAPLNDEIFVDLLYAWQTMPFGISFPYTRVEPMGEVDLPDGKALAYRVVREKLACLPEGVLEAKPYEGTLYLREGKVVGEAYFSPVLGAETLSLYRDFREEGGVRYPLRTEGYVWTGDRWAPFTRGETLEARVGVALGEEVFR